MASHYTKKHRVSIQIPKNRENHKMSIWSTNDLPSRDRRWEREANRKFLRGDLACWTAKTMKSPSYRIRIAWNLMFSMQCVGMNRLPCRLECRRIAWRLILVNDSMKKKLRCELEEILPNIWLQQLPLEIRRRRRRNGRGISVKRRKFSFDWLKREVEDQRRGGREWIDFREVGQVENLYRIKYQALWGPPSSFSVSQPLWWYFSSHGLASGRIIHLLKLHSPLA